MQSVNQMNRQLSPHDNQTFLKAFIKETRQDCGYKAML